jgi:ATP-dependent Lon protease
MLDSNYTKELPLIPLRDIVIYPGMIVPLFVGRQKSVDAIFSTENSSNEIFLVTQKDPEKTDPSIKDLYKVGVIAKINQIIKLHDGTLKVLIEGKQRALLNNLVQKPLAVNAQISLIDETEMGLTSEAEALKRIIIDKLREYGKFNSKITSDVISRCLEISLESELANFIASYLVISIPKKQKLLEIIGSNKRLRKILNYIEHELEILKTEVRIRQEVKKHIEKNHKDYVIHEQIKALQKELSNGEDSKNDIEVYQQKIKKLKLTKEAKEKALAEIRKLNNLQPSSSEANISRNYLDCLLNLPWNENSKLNSNLNDAEKTLNSDHYGLEKVKDRIIEFLAVQKKTKSNKGPILCFVGPPGVGKTSLAKSIASATNREYLRFALGGIRDEADIRGHRKTYLGSMPGKLITLMKKGGKSNPVILLDEIDKMAKDYRGDPEAAMLEVLDPEQNSKFTDHYLEVEYDLSNVMFIATANTTKMSRPLLDRMEIIRLAGYTEEEKLQIAKCHLIPKQLKEHGMSDEDINLSDDAVIDIIRYYTRESGVRGLEKQIAKLIRKILTNNEKTQDTNKKYIKSNSLDEYLGVRRFSFGKIEEKNLVGITSGLAYSELGGDILSIEALALPGKGTIKATGKLGKVMQESAQAAYSYFISVAEGYGVDQKKISKTDIHIHVPEGATPKDGPSAGIAMLTSIASALTGNPVDKNLAMTGEITLRGRILPIGGLKEKLLAAMRSGVKTVLIPKENMKDLAEMPDYLLNNIEIIAVEEASEVLNRALIATVSGTKQHQIRKLDHIIETKIENEVLTH